MIHTSMALLNKTSNQPKAIQALHRARLPKKGLQEGPQLNHKGARRKSTQGSLV